MEFEGFVLVGGRSSRFGSDKAMARWRGRPLLEYPVRLLRDLGAVPRLVGPDPTRYAGFSHAFVLGERPGRGPVEGLRAALRAAAAPRILVLPVDMPALTASLCRVLLALPADRAGCLVSEDRVHPFPGVYPRIALAALTALPEGSSMQAALRALEARTVDAARLASGGAAGSPFLNVNRPRDLKHPDASQKPD